jgi:uncharacterized protein (DUF433 family)
MWTDYIEQNKDVLGGKPVINHTRIAVGLVLEKIGNGETIGDLIMAYPRLSRVEILAFIAFGESLARNEIFIEVA